MRYLVKENNIRIDKFLTEQTEFSRSMVQKLIEDNCVVVNALPISKSTKLKEGDVVDIEIPELKSPKVEPQDITLNILYEDKDILVINKQKGLVVHPGNGNKDNTLVNSLLYHVKDLSGIGGVLRPGIIHRIDKDTSGALIVAKNDNSHSILSNDLKNHDVCKTYIALVRGIIPEDNATINIPIARSKTDRKKMAVDKDGKNAITHFRVLSRFETSNSTLLEINIETGRTHQIRVHMAHIKHPIIGDEVYSNGKNIWNIQGQMLHAYNLKFNHPVTNKNLDITAPLPKYFEDILSDEIKNNNVRNLEIKNGKITKIPSK